MKIKLLWNGKITPSFTGVGKSSPCPDFLTWQICLLKLFEKKRILAKFLNLQYILLWKLSVQKSADQDPHVWFQSDSMAINEILQIKKLAGVRLRRYTNVQPHTTDLSLFCLVCLLLLTQYIYFSLIKAQKEIQHVCVFSWILIQFKQEFIIIYLLEGINQPRTYWSVLLKWISILFRGGNMNGFRDTNLLSLLLSECNGAFPSMLWGHPDQCYWMCLIKRNTIISSCPK